MKYFLYRLFLFVITSFLLLILLAITWDPFRVFLNYPDYYTNNVITSNREHICVKLLEKRSLKPTSFIIGNSRSQAFKTSYWSQKIKISPSNCFHYDASNMGLFRAKNAITYLAKSNYKVDNILLIIDNDFFYEVNNPSGPLLIQPSCVSNENKVLYYWTFVKASFNFNFIFNLIVYKIFKKHYGFMGFTVTPFRYPFIFNNHTADLWYGFDKEIKNDSVNYYQKLLKKGIFYTRNTKQKVSKKTIFKIQLDYLGEIKKIIEEYNINLEIVISPLYNQIAFNPSDKKILKKMFGEDRVHDFSGKNAITSKISNYYESSHYRPHVANKLMDSIYNKKK